MFCDNYDVDRIAVFDENNVNFTYGKLNSRAEELLSVVPTRRLIVIMCERDIETVCFYYCMFYNHVVPIMLDGSLSEELLMNIVHNYHPEYIWAKKSDNIIGVVVYETDKHVLVKTKYKSPKLNDNLALLLSTSGSTGSRKLVRLSYDNIKDNAKCCVNVFGFETDDVGTTVLPINYCYGLSVLHYHWSIGACVFVSERSMMDEEYWNNLREYKVTSLQIVPYNFTIMKRINKRIFNELFLRTIVCGGGKMHSNDAMDAYNLFHDFGINFHIAYGQTECVSAICSLMNEEIINRTDSVGRTYEGINASSDSKDDELIISGKCISLGYANDFNDLGKGDSNQGILHTGDCAEIDSDGYIYLKGRKNRYIKILGIRYSLDEIESIMKNHFGINDIVCGETDNLLRIYVAENIDLNEIQLFCVDKFAIKRRIIKVIKVDKIPRNESGKIIYSELK